MDRAQRRGNVARYGVDYLHSDDFLLIIAQRAADRRAYKAAERAKKERRVSFTRALYSLFRAR